MEKKILITDDHYIIRAGTAFLLESKLTIPCTVDFADSFRETKDKIRNEQYDLLILDIDMPDSIFKAMIKEIKSIQENIKILIFSMYEEDVAMQYIYEGADGYLNKNSLEAEIVNAVQTILENGNFYTPKIMSMILSHSKNPVEKLSEREFEVFKLLVQGNGNIEISKILNLQMSTVSTYKRKVLEKLNVKTVVELVRINDGLH